MTKRCSICKESKPKSAFNRNAHKGDGLQNVCRECNRENSKKYYAKNSDRIKKQNAASRKIRHNINRKRVFEYLSNNPCTDCGESDPVVLEFDHRENFKKEGNISAMLRDGIPWERIYNEIKKCEVRCANCHRRKTAKQQSWYTETMKNK